MYKRALILYCFIMLLFCLAIFRIDFISSKETLYEAASSQQSYKVKIGDVRGTIYDCRNVPLVNNKKQLVASVVPCLESLKKLTPVVCESQKEELFKKCSGNHPFTIKVNEKVKSPYIKIFEVPVRYLPVTLASHIIGYLSGEKEGVCGLEKSFNDYLSDKKQEILVKYKVDATGKILPGKRNITQDKSYFNSKGIALNIDSKIQAIAEESANKYISRGAVVISEISDCRIRACASFPCFSYNDISEYLNDKNSPLLNRSFCDFNVGSVFKLVTAAAALESGISEDFIYNCEGHNEVDDVLFKCFNSKKHESINMEEAMAYSCNGYFIELIKKMPKNSLLQMAKKFRLGKPVKLAPKMETSSGTLPDEKSLEDMKTLANFSFGQGKLLANPFQILGVVNTVASGGVYTNPKLIKCLFNEAMKPTAFNEIKEEKETVISKSTAEKLKAQMKASMDYGTSEKGKPEFISAAAKTSTAQTGIVENGKKIEQSWFAGFFPYENPKYAVVVLSEAGSGGGESCGPVFKEIADRMATELPELFMEN
ncbi:MAG: penicillin-binding protein 2 [Clostridia bacterium]|nr:penicillin-binding protein 2 [Clostridia bacterium]